MADPLSLTASVIAVAGAAYTSTKALYDLISAIRDAPRVFQNLNQYIAALNQILDALRTDLDGRGARLSEGQLACLGSTIPNLEGCDHTCREFRKKVEGLTAHSQDGRRSFRDISKLMFQKKSIADFQMRLADWKESLSLALDVLLLTSSSANTETLRALEVKMANAEVRITTNIEMVKARLDKLLASETESEEDQQAVIRKTQAEEQQMMVLKQCLSMCKMAADGATQTTGHSFRNNQIFDDVRAIYGDVGQVPLGSARHTYDSNIGRGRARAVNGNMDGASFADFMR